MSNLKPYSALGGVFEYLNDDCDYIKWSQYLIETLNKLSVGKEGLDIGCGNGYFTRAFIKAGFDVQGMDVSEEMLSRAVEISAKEGVKAEFLLGDITKLNLKSAKDFITAVNDCINYVPQDKLSKTFERVYKNLKKGGVFIFDISSEKKLREEIGNNLFADDREDMTLLWFNTLKEDKVEMEITLFIRNKDGSYIRKDEAQTQYIHGVTDVLSALEGVGFKVRTEEVAGQPKEKRINFICRKI